MSINCNVIGCELIVVELGTHAVELFYGFLRTQRIEEAEDPYDSHYGENSADDERHGFIEAVIDVIADTIPYHTDEKNIYQRRQQQTRCGKRTLFLFG